MPKLQFTILIGSIVISGIIVAFGPRWYEEFTASQKERKCAEREVLLLIEEKLEASGGSDVDRKDLLLDALELQVKYGCD